MWNANYNGPSRLQDAGFERIRFFTILKCKKLGLITENALKSLPFLKGGICKVIRISFYLRESD